MYVVRSVAQCQVAASGSIGPFNICCCSEQPRPWERCTVQMQKRIEHKSSPRTTTGALWRRLERKSLLASSIMANYATGSEKASVRRGGRTAVTTRDTSTTMFVTVKASTGGPTERCVDRHPACHVAIARASCSESTNRMPVPRTCSTVGLALRLCDRCAYQCPALYPYACCKAPRHVNVACWSCAAAIVPGSPGPIGQWLTECTTEVCNQKSISVNCSALFTAFR